MKNGAMAENNIGGSTTTYQFKFRSNFFCFHVIPLGSDVNIRARYAMKMEKNRCFGVSVGLSFSNEFL